MQVRTQYFRDAVDGSLRSSAFNLDVALNVWRNCYEGQDTWLNTSTGAASYAAGDAWGCIGRWFCGRWYTHRATTYIAAVQDYLNQRIWDDARLRQLTADGSIGTSGQAAATTATSTRHSGRARAGTVTSVDAATWPANAASRAAITGPSSSPTTTYVVTDTMSADRHPGRVEDRRRCSTTRRRPGRRASSGTDPSGAIGHDAGRVQQPAGARR